MQFNSASAIEQVVWAMRLADYPRALDRARIDALANGAPPYPLDEAELAGQQVNVNDLTMTRLAHDARMQLYGAHTKPGNFFAARTDMGAQSRRGERGHIVTNEANRLMRRSNAYDFCLRSKFAMMVMHGRGPSVWQDPYRWRPKAVAISDILIPGGTTLDFENLPFFAVRRSFSVPEMKRMTRHADKNNPGWNMPVVRRAMEWVDEETRKLFNNTSFNEFWAPDKREERLKSNSGIYSGDRAATIDCYDFYYWDDAKKHEGWRRRIIFDADGGSGAWNGPAGYGAQRKLPDKNLLGSKDDFLFSSGDRVVADRFDQILHFQLADLSSFAPFEYHSVRSLGFLVYAACHLQNRLRCALAEASFETLMQYFRVASSEEVERALSINLINRGIWPDSLRAVSPAERWQPNYDLANLGLNELKQVIQDNSSSFVQNQNWSRDRVEKTRFQVMAEIQAMQTLVSAALQQSYRYQGDEYREDFRRFLSKHSTCPDANEFRSRCIARGVPERLLIPDAWDIQPERILGGGNQTLEMAIAQQLMDWKQSYNPEAQMTILRDATLAITGDPAKAADLVPQTARVSDTKHDAMVAYGSLMVGGAVQFTGSANVLETAGTLIGELGLGVEQVMQMGGMTTLERVMGFENVLKHISQLVGVIAKDKAAKPVATQMAQTSGKLANLVKGMRQRVMQKMKAEAEQAGQNGEMAKAMAKIQADQMMAEAKMANTRESHAQRTAQRQAQWEMEQEQKVKDRALDRALQVDEARVDVAVKDAEVAAEIRREDARPKPETKSE